VFCEIASGEAAAHVVYENDQLLAFLDLRPLFSGHVLLIPRAHYDTLPELPTELLQPLFETAQRLCRAVQTALHAEGTFVAINNVVSQSVPHLHVHVVPRRKGDGLKGFFWPRSKYESENHARDTAQLIRSALAG
jgi:histidine triad (HIT) family protein